MIKLLVGLLKGAVIGVAVGYGAFAADVHLAPWLLCGIVGVLIGLFVGRPIWTLISDKNATTVAAFLKMAVGFGVGVGLWALLAKAWNPAPNLLVIANQDVLHWVPAICGAIGAVYGAFVEVDDGMEGNVGGGAARDNGGSKAIVSKKK